MNFSESASAVPFAGRGLVLEENVLESFIYVTSKFFFYGWISLA
jgi:hypothetical protein